MNSELWKLIVVAVLVFVVVGLEITIAVLESRTDKLRLKRLEKIERLNQGTDDE